MDITTSEHAVVKYPTQIVRDGLYKHYKSHDKVMSIWWKSLKLTNSNGSILHFAEIQIRLAINDGENELIKLLIFLWSKALNMPISQIFEKNQKERELPGAADPNKPIQN